MERQGQQEDSYRKDSSAANANTSTPFPTCQRPPSAYERHLPSTSDCLPHFSWNQNSYPPIQRNNGQTQAITGWRESSVSGFPPRFVQPTHFGSTTRLGSLDDTWNIELPPNLLNLHPSLAMPSPLPQHSTTQHSMPANIIDLTEDDESPHANPHILQTHQNAPRRRHERQARATSRSTVVPEIIDLESPEQNHLVPPPFMEPDAAPGRHHQESHRWEPEIEITGHAVHNSTLQSPSHVASPTWPHALQADLAQHILRLQPHRHAPPRQPPPNGSSRTTIGNPTTRTGPRLPSRVMRYFSGLGSQISTATRMPVLLNYNRAAFDLSLQNGSADFAATHAEAAQARNPTSAPRIEPLAAPRLGFTRAPTTSEDAVPVCPNCEMELCSGNTEIKRQVFAVKGCGHVYCGECALNRHKTSPARQKGKERGGAVGVVSNGMAGAITDTFAQCVVPGCGQSTRTKQSMVQIFL